MNHHARWRLDFARMLNRKLDLAPGLKAVMVIGSVARGYSDAYSDLEIMLVWDQLPSIERQEAIAEVLQAQHRYPAFDPGYQSAFRIQGLPVDLWYTTAAQEEAMIRPVLIDYSLDLVANNRLDTLRSCIPLRGTDLVQRWKTISREYPEELTIRFLQTYLPHFHLRQLHLAAQRNNLTSCYQLLSSIQCSLFLLLLALNKAYFPTFKWIYPTLAVLPVSPAQIVERLQHMFHQPPVEAAAHLREVLAETVAIVEARYPQIDTAYARYGLAQAPQTYESA
jgi:predicted nucleotidyltransferase